MKLIEKNKKFFDNFSKYYDFGLIKSFLMKIQRKVIKNAYIKKGSKILDAGCGTGNFLVLLSHNKTLKLHGIDISSKMLKVSRKKLEKKAKLKLLSVESLKEKSKYNYIFSIEAFHHFSDQKKAMENFYSALKRGGIFTVVDFDFGKFFNWVFHNIEPGNSKMNSKEDFYNLFKNTGFDNIEQKRLGLMLIMTKGIK